jgi:hypothetical protein
LRPDRTATLSQDQRPDRITAASETLAMRSRARSNEEEEGNDRGRSQPAGTAPGERRETYPETNVNETLRAHSVKQSWSEHNPPEVLNDTARRTNVPFERSDTSSARVRSGSSKASGDAAGETDPGKRATLFRELDQVRRVDLEEAREEASSLLVFRQTSVNEPAVSLNRGWSRLEQGSERQEARQRSARKMVDDISRASELAPAADRRTANQPASARDTSGAPEVNVSAADKQERNLFASVDLSAPALIEPGESVWPTLPAAPRFEMADELATMEREAETLWRLDQEQRGTLWNA